MSMSEKIKLLNNSFCLPCGYVLPNRLVKSGMTEHLADSTGLPNRRHLNLYAEWAKGGAAFLLTGNVMIDQNNLEGVGNVVLDHNQPIEQFKLWSDTVKENGSQIWMQIGHAGGLSVSENSLSPSGIRHVGKVRIFPQPKIMTEEDISDVIKRFTYAANVAKETGFAGVEIHSAHQFLLNQFLSPLTNKRTDRYGGSLENRMRLLLEVVRSVRHAVGVDYPVAVKLNSSDGLNLEDGWTESESLQVLVALEREGIDLLEISGGSYEATPMFGPDQINTNEKPKEAFFLGYASQVRKITKNLPIMLTAGMRSAKVMVGVIEDGTADIIGMARPFAVMPDVAKRILSGELDSVPRFEGESLPVMEQLKWFQDRMTKIADGVE